MNLKIFTNIVNDDNNTLNFVNSTVLDTLKF